MEHKFDRKKITVYVAIPTMDNIKVETASSIIQYVQDRHYPSMVNFHRHSAAHRARNILALQAIDKGATHLMFIDDDMVFEPTWVDQLVDHDKDIVGGVYRSRHNPDKVMVYDLIDRRINERRVGEGLVQVDAVATGFMLIKTSALLKMYRPWFKYAEKGINNNDGLIPVIDHKDKFPNHDLGEDISFCLSAGKQGIGIYADYSITPGHIGETIYRY